MSKKSFLFLIVALALTNPAHAKIDGASTQKLNDQAEDLAKDVSDFVIAKDNSSKLSPEETLSYKKKILDSAISLAEDEVTALIKKIDSIESLKAEALKDKYPLFLEHKESLLDELKLALKHYQSSKELLRSIDELEAIQSLITEENLYRKESYLPLSAKVIEFQLAFQAEDLLNNTKKRFDKITSDLEKINKKNNSHFSQIKTEMGIAKNHLEKTAELIEQSKDTYLKTLTKKEPLEQTDLATTKDDLKAKEDKDEESRSKTSKELSEEALKSLKSVYDSFIKISSLAKKMNK